MIGFITNVLEDTQVECLLYYVKFYNDDMVFWKIGVTTRSIHKRFGSDEYIKYNYNLSKNNLYYTKMDAYNCFKMEQEILRAHKENRVIIDIPNFKSTECFSTDIFKDQKDFDEFTNRVL